MKRNVIMIAILVMGLCNQSQASFAKNWWKRQSRDDKEFITGSGKVLGTLAALWGAANFYANRFPTTKEAKNIARNETALSMLNNIHEEISILGASPSAMKDLFKDKIFDRAAQKDNIKNLKENNDKILELTNRSATINNMIKLVESIKLEIIKDTERNTEALQKIEAARGNRSWKDFLLNKNNPYMKTKK